MAVGVSCAVAVTLATPVVAGAAERTRVARRGPATTITVDGGADHGPTRPLLLGANQPIMKNANALWEEANDRPDPLAVERLRRAGVSLLRFPGGTEGNFYDWKRSVGEDRGCQTNGQPNRGGFVQMGGRAYGPDEHMELVDALGASTIMVVPFVTETPADAADWVEYMNTRNDGPGGVNPNEGVDWALERAENGHPAPYGVKVWEIGNEQRVHNQRYWMSEERNKALQQYVDGDTVAIADEALGKDCWRVRSGVPSDGGPGQVFEIWYPPAKEGSVEVKVDGEEWTEVESFVGSGLFDRHYTVDETEGTVTFGDGLRGAIPPEGATVRASYQSTHAGFFAFARKMRAVDPGIKICATWGLKEFVHVAGNRGYDCFSAHAYTHFQAEGHHRWDSALDGHDWHMRGVASETGFVAGLKQALPAGVSMAVTEFGAVRGDTATYPQWMASMTHATYMASMWVNLLNLGVPLGTGGVIQPGTDRAVLGSAPDWRFTAEALTRQALRPVFASGGHRVRASVSGDPVRHRGTQRSYRALAVTATRGRDGDLFVVVVNRLPQATQSVRASVRFGRFYSTRVAHVSRVNGPSFRSWNPPGGPPQVRLSTTRIGIGRSGFVHTFPAHSVTVLRVPPATRAQRMVRLTASASTGWVAPGGRVAVRGRLVSARTRAGVAREPLAVYGRRPGGGAWARLGRVRTDRAGRYALVHRPRRSYVYQVRHRRSFFLAAASDEVRVTVRRAAR